MNQHLFLKKTPFVRFLFIFILGIFLTYSFFDLSGQGVFILSITISVILVALILLQFTTLPKLVVDIVLSILLFGVAIVVTTLSMPDSQLNLSDSKVYTAEISDNPQFKNKSMLVPAKVFLEESGSGLKKYQINIYTAKDSILAKKFVVGRKINFRGKIERIRNYGNPGEFNYVNFMASKGIFYQVWVKQTDFILLESGSSGVRFKMLLDKIRKSVLTQIEKYIQNDDSKSLVLAFVTGDRTLISDEMRDAYVHAGVVHILSVSGLHIGIIFMFFNFFLKSFDRNLKLKIIKTVLIILVVWFYALISGLSSSVVRSAMMFTLISIGQTFRRDISFYNIMAASAFIMLLFNPLQLFDIGFQLSYLAVLGIVYFQPKFSLLFCFSSKFGNYYYQLQVVSFAAQLATFPLIVFYFHQFPVYFWLANMFVIPLTFVLMVGIVAFLLTSFIPVFGSFFGTLNSVIAWVLNKIVVLVDSLPGSLIDSISFSKSTALLIFILIIFLSIWLEFKKSRAFVTSIFICCLILLLNISSSVIHSTKHELVFFNTPGQSTFGVFSGNQKCYIFSSAKEVTPIKKVISICRPYWERTNKSAEPKIYSLDSVPTFLSNHKVQNPKNVILSLNDTRKLLVYNRFVRNFDESALSDGDIVFVAGNFSPPIKAINAKEVVLSSEMNHYFVSMWEKYLVEIKIAFHTIMQDGAYEIELQN